MNFVDTIKTNPPRLVVKFRYSADKTEEFEWGVVGNIPIITLIGAIASAQSSLINCEWMAEATDVMALIIVYHHETRTLESFIHRDVPVVPMVGMLEVIKSMVVACKSAQTVASKTSQILGPDGGPMRK